jgi:hypothetical protein
MQHTKNRSINNRFILALSKVSDSIDYLSYLARQALFTRDYSKLAAISEELINLSPSSESIGQYYQALANLRYGRGERETIAKTLSHLAECPLDQVRAASLVALSAFESFDQKTSQTSINILREASSLALKRNFLITYFQAQSSLSLTASINGDHKKSLKILKELYPAISSIEKRYPQLTFDYLNSIAYELSCTGETEAAHKLITDVVKSPLVRIYPEWIETAEEIREKCQHLHATRSKVFAPVKVFTSADEYKEPVNFYFELDYKGDYQELFAVPLDNTDVITDFLLYIFKSINRIGTNKNTGIRVIGYLSGSNDPENLGYEKNIDASVLNWLFVFMESVVHTIENKSAPKRTDISYPLPKDNPMIQKILKKLMSSLRHGDAKEKFGVIRGA